MTNTNIFHDQTEKSMTFQALKMIFQNSMTFQVFHDLYEPCLYYAKTKLIILNKLIELLEAHSSFRIQYQLLTMSTFYEIAVITMHVQYLKCMFVLNIISIWVKHTGIFKGL